MFPSYRLLHIFTCWHRFGNHYGLQKRLKERAGLWCYTAGLYISNYMLAVSSTQVARTLCEELVEIDAHWRVFSARYCERKGVWVCVWVLPRGVWKGVERKDHPLFWFRTWASWHIRTWTRAELVYLWMRSKNIYQPNLRQHWISFWVINVFKNAKKQPTR